MDACQPNLLVHHQPEGFAQHRSRSPIPCISLVLPAYNEQESIAQAICEADEALATLTPDYEILVIDDGSSDATFAIATEQAQHRAAVKVLRQPTNVGYGAALRLGFEAARGSLLAFTDADCQFDLRELDRLVMLAKDYDIVCGYRIERQDRLHRKFFSGAYNVLTRVLLGTRVRDCDCALKVLRREVVTSTSIESNGFFVNAELLAKAGLDGKSIVEVGVTHRPRAAGESKVSLRHVIPVASILLRFWWRSVLFPASASELQRGSDRWPVRFEIGAVLLLCMTALLLLFGRLSYPLIEPDETRYAQIAFEMAQSGDWITPTLDGRPYLDKPPLLYWATAASFKAFGTNELAARFPCAISAFLTVLLTYWLGRRLVGSRGAWYGAVALLLCGGFVLSGRFLIMDGPLTLFGTVTLLTSYLACSGTRIRIGCWAAAAVACALGILTKGPIAVVLCAPPILAARWLSDTKSRILLRHWVTMAAVVVLLTAPWFVAVSLANKEFPEYFFWRHNVVRFVNAFNHEQPWWFYFPVLLAGMFPASLLLPALASFLFRRRSTEQSRRSQELGFLVLAASWIVFFFSLSSCKLPTYVLPALPPICLMIGSLLDTMVFAPGVRTMVARNVQRIPKRAALAASAIAVTAATVDLTFIQEGGFGWVLDVFVLVAASVLLVAFSRVSPSRSRAAWAFSAAVALAAMMFVFADIVPEFSRVRSIHAKAAKQHQQRGQPPVVYFAHEAYSARLHLEPRRFVRFSSDQLADVGRFLKGHPEVILVTTRDAADSIRSRFGSSVELTASDASGRLYVARARQLPIIRVGAKDSSRTR